MFSNIWKHPRTSIAGALISVATVAGVLAQQGITLGSLGSGTVVSLSAALATALLGLVARDPGSPAPQPPPACSGSGSCKGLGGTEKLGAWLLVVLLVPLPSLQGCTSHSVAQDIVNWMPTLEGTVTTIDSTVALLPVSDAPAFLAATSGLHAAADLLVAQAKSYLANSSADTLAALQIQVVALQQLVNSALLTTGRLIDSPGQKRAIAAIQTAATVVTAILTLVQTLSSKAQVAQMASRAPIKLATVAPYFDANRSAQLIAAHYRESVETAQSQIGSTEIAQQAAGF